MNGAARTRLLAAVVALAIAFAVKLAVLWSLGPHPLLVPAGDLDAAYYYHLAQRVGAGDLWLVQPESFFGQPPPPFFLSPLYVYFLAFLLEVGGGSLAAARFVQVALGAGAVGLLALTARRWYGPAAAWAAGALAAACGLFTFYEILIVEAAIEPLLAALDMYLLTRALQDRSLRWWAAAGAALGLHALNRPAMLIVFAGLAAVVLVWSRMPRRIAAAAAFIAAGCLMISPVAVRNWHVSGDLIPIAGHTGLYFLVGNGPEATGTRVRTLDIEPNARGRWLDASRVAAVEAGRDLSPGEVWTFFVRSAFDWMRQHPGRAVKLAATKLWYTFSATFLPLDHSYKFFARDASRVLMLLAVGPAILVPLGLVGLFVAGPRQRIYFAWAAYVPLVVLSIVIFFVSSRDRLSLHAALVVAGGGALAWAGQRVREQSWGVLGASASTAAVLAAIVVWPTGLDDGRAEEQARMGLAELQSNRTVEGEKWIGRAASAHRQPAGVYLRAGQIYEGQERPEEAMTHYRRALALDPEDSTVHFLMGRALFQQRKDLEATRALERVRSGPQLDGATRLRVLALSRLGWRDEANLAVRQLDPSRWRADQAREFALGLAEVGRADLSVVAWRRAAEASGEAADSERLGLTWVVLGDMPQAIAAFSDAVRRDPRSASARLNYAVAFASVGRAADARREAEAALRIDPSYERARQFLASLK